MNGAPNFLNNDFEVAVSFLFPTNPVTKKSKDKRSIYEISATTADVNKTGGGNSPKKKIGHKVGSKVGT